MYMSTQPLPFETFGWIFFAKYKVFIRYLAKFQQKSFFLKKTAEKRLEDQWKMAGRYALAERYLPAIMLLIV